MALVLACATFPLIFVGGLVTTYKAGMSVPDWPSTYGYNLFLYPWETWLYGPFDLFIEHGHRLLGSTVGILTIGLVFAVWRWDGRPWMRSVSVAALAGVIAQGILGGIRVRQDSSQLAMLHGCFGPAFFALTATIVVFTSGWWHRTTRDRASRGDRLLPLGLLTLALAYGQLVVGAILRHTPVDAPYSYFRGAVFFHLILAVVLVLHAAGLAWTARRAGQGSKVVRRAALALFGFVSLQILLGAATWIVKYGWPNWAARWSWNADYTVQSQTLFQSWTITAHVANGSLILATSAVLITLICRVYGLDELQPFTGETHQDVFRESDERRFERLAVERAETHRSHRGVRR